MQPVAVRILHPAPAGAGPLELALVRARARNSARLASLFAAAGATDVATFTDADGAAPFGARLRGILDRLPRRAGLVILGSGAMPLASRADAGRYVAVAASGQRRALANNRYSADIVAIGRPDALRDLPDLPSDNALPRWLEEAAGFEVDDLRRRWRLAIDLDSPLDVVLAGRELDGDVDTSTVRERLARVRSVALDRRAEVLIAGRTSAATLRWLERRTPSRTRVLVEERGLRASSADALGGPDAGMTRRPPRSVLGLLLDAHGPKALGAMLAGLADAALVDTRVLLAHRLGADERAWPGAEDRFASDLLLPARVADPWLRSITAAARDSTIPVLLGGHTLVGPGLRLALGARGGPRE